jgi:hypothetical protein
MANINDPNASLTDQALRGTIMGGAEPFDPIIEDNYWSENYSSRPYASSDLGYAHYQPAYRFGWEQRLKWQGHRWEDAEPQLMREWDAAHPGEGEHRSTWEQFKAAVRDAWDRVGSRDRDRR